MTDDDETSSSDEDNSNFGIRKLISKLFKLKSYKLNLIYDVFKK